MALNGSGVAWVMSGLKEYDSGIESTAVLDSSAWYNMHLERPSTSGFDCSSKENPPVGYLRRGVDANGNYGGLSSILWQTGGAYTNATNGNSTLYGNHEGGGLAIAEMAMFSTTGLSIAEVSAMADGQPAAYAAPYKATYCFRFNNHQKQQMAETGVYQTNPNSWHEGPDELITKLLYTASGNWAWATCDRTFPSRRAGTMLGDKSIQVSAVYVNMSSTFDSYGWDGDWDTTHPNSYSYSGGASALAGSVAYSGVVQNFGWNFYDTERPHRYGTNGYGWRMQEFWTAKQNAGASWKIHNAFTADNEHRYYERNAVTDFNVENRWANHVPGRWNYWMFTIAEPDSEGWRRQRFYLNGQLVESSNDLSPHDLNLEKTHWVPTFVNAAATIGAHSYAATDANSTSANTHHSPETNAGFQRMSLWDAELDEADARREYHNALGADPTTSYSTKDQNLVADWLFHRNNVSSTPDASGWLLQPCSVDLEKYGMHEDGGFYKCAGGTYMVETYTNSPWSVRNPIKFNHEQFINRTTRNSQDHPFKLYNLGVMDGALEPEFKLFAKKVFGPGGVQMPRNSGYDDIITFSWTIEP
jgi:hypothetical protein